MLNDIWQGPIIFAAIAAGAIYGGWLGAAVTTVVVVGLAAMRWD